MQQEINRMQFLRGDFKGEKAPRRPPWAQQEKQFLELCDDGCDKCITACEERILIKGRGGYPEVDFKQGECTFCEDCLRICPTDALVQAYGEDGGRLPPWEASVELAPHCIALQGIDCRICGEECELGAIRFRLVAGKSAAVPELDQELCNGCGACVPRCPVLAVNVELTPPSVSTIKTKH